MIFANVNDIAIPQGNVIKIHETISGRILWEKKPPVINPVWNILDVRLAYVSAGDKGAIRCFSRNDKSSRQGFSLCSVCISDSNFDAWGKWGDVSTGNNSVSFSYHPGGMTGQIGYNILAATDCFNPDGSYGVIYAKDVSSNSYFFLRGPDTYYLSVQSSNNYRLNTLQPRFDNSVRITYAPELNQYLVTGLASGRACILPADFNSGTSLNYLSGSPYSKFKNTHWVSEHNSYYAASGTDKKIYSSMDGINWSEVTAATKGSVFDVFYLSKQNKLCAVSNNQISISDDGSAWLNIEVPFSEAIVAAYSDDLDYLCVADKNNAYLTYDFVNWFDAKIPLNRSVNFSQLIYLHHGIFAATKPVNEAPKGEFYLLSLSLPYPLSINSNYLIA
jgi:hypothetical protein